MNDFCGCCAGIHEVTPEPHVNRPGLNSIGYRVGTHATFFETMKARLSNLNLDDPAGGSAIIRPLQNLTTREQSDPAIALLDAWATVADVLTFYQERFANEGFLLTATERRSILELARLIGYRLRPGVAASVFLAYTLEKDYVVEIPLGARVQSIPAPGELPQSFETSEKLIAHAEWNLLQPRRTRPQLITAGTSSPGTDAATRETLYFAGTQTKLSAGDAVVINVNAQANGQALRFVKTVNAQTEYDRTVVTLVAPPAAAGSTVTARLQVFVAEAAALFSGSKLADQAVAALQELIDGIMDGLSQREAGNLLIEIQTTFAELHQTAAKRGLTRLEAWLSDISEVVDALTVDDILHDQASATMVTLSWAKQLSSFGSLFALVKPLSIAPSVPPPSSRQLPRSTANLFAAQSDISAQLLTTLNPAIGASLYQAWGKTEPPPVNFEVGAVRVKAGLFPGSYPGKVTISEGNITGVTAPTITSAWGITATPAPPATVIPLDAIYDKIQAGSWIVVERPVFSANQGVVSRARSYHQVTEARTITRGVPNETYSARITEVSISPPWFRDSDLRTNEARSASYNSTDVLHGTVVYAQTETLELAEEPLDTDISGKTIELDDLYAGLDSGRWLLISGDRTDIPNVSGVTATELVMLGGVTQGSSKGQCVPFPGNVIPFTSNFSITPPDANNDSFISGILSDDGVKLIKEGLPVPSVPNQQYCEPVQLAPGLFADAYVPRADERNPNTDTPYMWRIKTPSGPRQTTLLLSDKLAYSYDRATVKIYGNVVKATHGETKNEVLGSGDGSQELQQFTLLQSPLTYLAAPTPAGAESTLQVRVNDVLWHETDNLVGLSPKERSFVTSANDSDKTTVQFGDGEFGARLPTGVENVKAVYRVGIGAPGNVKAGQITSVITKPLGVKEVVNPLAASGGAGREEFAQARQNAPLAVMALDRLVSVQDYADFARTYAGIAKASATRISDGRRQLIHVTVAGNDDVPIDTTSDLYVNLRRALLVNGDPYQVLQLAVRKLKLLVISARVRLLPDYLWDAVEPKIRAAIADKFSFGTRDLAQSAFASEALSVIQAIPEVAYVDLDVFDAVAEDTSPQGLANLGSTLKLQPRILVYGARVERKVTDPAKRILPAELAYLNPTVADTLILTEISG